MKVLLIDVNCKNSSTGNIVYSLYERLLADGHKAAICYGRGPRIAQTGIYKFGLDIETCIHAGLARVTGLNGCFSPFSTGRLLRYIKKFQPDVVHIHELHAYFVNIAPLLRYLKKNNIKTVWTFHCAYMYTGKCGVTHGCQKWLTDCKHCPQVRSYPQSWLFDFAAVMFRRKKKLLQKFDCTIVTPSRFLADQVNRSFLKGKPLSVIPNGIETSDCFHPRSQAECQALLEAYGLQDKQVILSVAPNIMSTQKGGPTVLELSKRFVGEKVHFVLVGADENAAPAPNVTLIKRTADQQELALWYSAADVFLICSRYENLPTTCLEAMCCGTPVVGIDSGGTKETVPAPFGLFTEPDDLCRLEEAVRQHLQQKVHASDISKAGIALYDQQVMYRAYLTLYCAAEERRCCENE